MACKLPGTVWFEQIIFVLSILKLTKSPVWQRKVNKIGQENLQKQYILFLLVKGKIK